MEHKLSKKAKIFLSVASAIIANTAVTTLLSSCSLSNKIDDLGGFDKEYGINNATYTRMEEDFEILYKSQLDQRKESGEINDDIYDSNLYAFQNKLNSLHTSLYSGENKALSYTIKTNVLRDYARDNYGIKLSRQSSVILDETIENVKSSIRSSVLLMCKEYGITDTSKYTDSANTKLDELEDEAKAKYGDTDVVSIIQHIQGGMTTCFNGICEELDCIATQQQLKQFIEKYSITVKEDITDDYYWDKLFSKYGDGNKEISVEDFNNIFIMACEESDPQNSNISYFSTSKKTEIFSNDLITGYTLKPILVKMNGDPYTNTYSIDVDYTLVNNDFIKKENVAQLTAHSSAIKNKSFYEDENTSIFDLNASDEEREYTNYVLPITKEYEQQQINATYFNNENFKFSWSTSDEYGYDDFWTEANENGEYKGKLDISGLATSGMMINGYLLSELLEKDESDKMPVQFNNAIRLVKNTNFSFDFTEKDYEVVKDDNKMGEIQANDFIIGYKNSKNNFNLVEEGKNIIEKAINDDSGITTRTSKKFWEHIKANYDVANNVLGSIDDLSNKLDDATDHVNGLIISALAFYNVALVIALFITVYAITYWIRKVDHQYLNPKCHIASIILLAFVAPIIPIAISASEKNSKFSEYLKSIKNEDNQFITNIKINKKYFYSSNNKEDYTEFDKLTLDEKRKLKIYYSTYNNKETVEDKKTQSQKDYEQFLKFNVNKEDLYSYLNDFHTWVWILADIWGIVAIIADIFIYYNHIDSAKTRYMWEHVSVLKIGIIVTSILSVAAVIIAIATNL